MTNQVESNSNDQDISAKDDTEGNDSVPANVMGPQMMKRQQLTGAAILDGGSADNQGISKTIMFLRSFIFVHNCMKGEINAGRISKTLKKT
ncbi:hypothetical protein E2C01_046237 [Portunus trituberculatus]|uniref:Uncharacterized protein n=1 Tax=Portunus trituberculatus TaxID=210409 RepID=A0A5B7G491_PORTR|nr:hypothetical protein [Portunus trituberculatus]